MRILSVPPVLRLLALVPFLVGGCSERPSPSVSPPASPAKSGQTKPPRQEVKPPDETHAAGRGITVIWQEPTKSGGIRKILEVNAETGELDAVTQSGALKDATGRFYREGKPRAKFAAPQVLASEDKRTVTARGGVVVNSIDPPGVALKADQITWYANQNQIVARGNVRMSHTPKGSSQPIAYGNVPQATANTELQFITVP